MPKTEAVQVWWCEGCGYRYEAPIPILSSECSNRHKKSKMKLIAGEPVIQNPPKKEPVRLSSRPKAQKVTNTDQLLEAFGIKESNV